MTPHNSLRSLALITTTAAATLLLIQACGGGAVAQSASDADAVEGVWDSVLSIKDCSSGAVLSSFKGLSVMHRGGTMSADNSRPPATRGAAFGTWKRGAANAFTSTMLFMRFNPDTSLAGTQKVQRSFTTGSDGNSITGTVAIQVIDAAGAVIQQACASEIGVRVN